MNPYDEAEMAARQRDVAETARALKARELPFLEGVRRVVALRFEVSREEHDPDFMIFVAVDSESDHIPILQMRSLCAESWLAKCDKETEELEAFYGEEVFAACETLLRRFSRMA